MYLEAGDDSAEAIGLRLRRIRMAAGWEQDRLAEEADVSKTSISYWETARYNKISPRSLAKILRAINKAGVECLEEWLLRGIGPQPQINFAMAETPAVYQALPSLHRQATEIKELALFSAHTPQAVVTEISHDQLAPWLRRGDFVGGIWRTAVQLVKSDFCIISQANTLPVYYVTPTNEQSFYLSARVTEDFSDLGKHHMTQIAPIVRVWRKIDLDHA